MPPRPAPEPDGDESPLFAGVSTQAEPSDVAQPTAPGPSAPVAADRTPTARGIAGAPALVLFVLVVASAPGAAVLVALIGGLIAFLVARSVLRRTG